MLPGMQFGTYRIRQRVEFLDQSDNPPDLVMGEKISPGRHGYNLIHWTESGMSYWLVSELNLPN
jgi:hypothetical protein